MTALPDVRAFGRKVRQLCAKSALLHLGFEVGVVFKGLNGILEVFGAILLSWTSPETMGRIVWALTRHELMEDRTDALANALLKLSHGYSPAVRNFAIFYLLSHGLVKIFLVAMLLRKKLWAYPLAIVFLLVFVLYQLERWSHSHSVGMLTLSVVDSALIVLTWFEYDRLRTRSTPVVWTL